MALWIILGTPLLLAAFVLYRRHAKQRKREKVLASSLTAEQRAVVERLVPLVRRLPPDVRSALEGKMNLFLDQITFRGENGVEVNEEMKLSIAAQACLLVVNSPVWYETLRNVLLYPSAFLTNRDTHGDGVVYENQHATLGESWARGPVILAWDHALQGGLDAEDGHNVVIHEFAHQLDGLSGHTNGIPILRKGQAYAGWEKAMLDAFQDQVRRVENGQSTLIDPYGATSHQEFFAEAIVTFFERPRAMRDQMPSLYEQLARLLALDPARWN
ncbi:M90 family metallopeptidase [Alteriqipengyuania sp. 357]